MTEYDAQTLRDEINDLMRAMISYEHEMGCGSIHAADHVIDEIYAALQNLGGE